MRHPSIARPAPLHTLTKAAEFARTQFRAAVLELRRRRNTPDLVRHHVPPWREVGPLVAPTAARSFGQAAERAGLMVAYRMAGDSAVQVGVARDGVLEQRATWHRTASGLWTNDGVIARGRKVSATEAKAQW